MINLMGAVLEVGICFLLLYFVFLKEEYVKKCKWLCIGFVGLIMAKILAESRLYSYASVGVLFVLTLFTSALVWLLIKREFMTILTITWTYYILISIMQVFIIFWGIEYPRREYLNSEYILDKEYKNIIITARGLVYIFSCIIIFFIVLHIKDKIQKRKVNIYEYENILVVFDIIFSLIFLCYGNVFYNMTIDIQKVETTKMLSFVLFSTLVAIIVVVLLKNKMIEKYNDTLQFQEELSKKRYEELTTIMSKNTQLVHDINNHLFMIQTYVKEEDIEGLKKYIQEVQKDYFPDIRKTWTGNQALDFILNQKKAEAECYGIDFQIQTEKGVELPITESEVCVIFGNLLDNAIEASAQVDDDKWIKIVIGKQKEMFFVNISNNYKVVPILRQGEYISTKLPKNAHGYGMKNARRIIEKYEGILKFRDSDDRFEAKISFFSNSQKEKKSIVEEHITEIDGTFYSKEDDKIFKIAFADLIVSMLWLVILVTGKTKRIFANTGVIISAILICGIIGEIFVFISRYREKTDGINYAVTVMSVISKVLILLVFLLVQLMDV